VAINLTNPISRKDRLKVLTGCGLGIAALTASERYVGPDAPLGGFFFLPLLVAAAFVSRGSIFLLAIATALLRESFGPLAWQGNAPARVALSLVAFSGGGLFAGELVRNRRMAAELLRKKQDAEKEARALVEGSPAAVLTVDSAGRIDMANGAARRMLGFDSGSPEGDLIENYLPLLAKLVKSRQVVHLVRTMMETSGRRRDGEAFYSQMWVSTYESASGPRMSVILSDTTEQLRDREESGLRQLLSHSKIIVGAVSHELRNLAAAAAVLHDNASNSPGLQDSTDFKALGHVIEGILKLSSAELSETSEESLEGLDVTGLLQELRTIVAPAADETETAIVWEVAPELPNVRAEHSGLLQVFLNLVKNSCSALQGRPDGRLSIAAYELAGSVVVRFSDNGPGISSAETLFRPFQAGASATGLGLFVSRAIVRTFGGELHHTQRPGECCFVVELPALASEKSAVASE
jgi:two-component system sensor kinase FixL